MLTKMRDQRLVHTSGTLVCNEKTNQCPKIRFKAICVVLISDSGRMLSPQHFGLDCTHLVE